MKRKKTAALFVALLILAGLLFSSCTTLESGKQVQLPMEAEASLIVIDSSGNALPVVYPASSLDNGVRYYLYNGEEMTREEIQSTLAPKGESVEEVGEIWDTSITDVFALFTPDELSERHLPREATIASLIYDMWKCLTTGPVEIRENPRAMLNGLMPTWDMRSTVFDYLEQKKQVSLGY